MNYVEFIAGNSEYKLRLSTRNIVALEKQIGCNPLMIFGNGNKVPTITEMVQILHASLQQYQHNITLEKAYEIFDTYLEDGHASTDFITTIIEIYKASGIMKAEQTPEEEGTEKN